MKLLIPFLALLFTLNAFGGNLPGILQFKLRMKMAAVDYQLALADAPTLLKDKDFKAKSEAALDAYGKDPVLASAMNLSSVGSSKAIETTAGGSGTLVNVMHTPALTAKDVYPVFGPLFLAFSADAFETYTTKVKGEKPEYILNEGKMNGLAFTAAKEISSLAALAPETESAIKEAITNKIKEKVKSADQTAIDPYKILSGINAQNKKAISDQALAPFASAEKGTATWYRPTDQEMIRYVLAASALLKTSVSTGKIKAKADADRMEKLVAELEYMANQAATFRGDKPAEPSPTAP